MHRIPTRTNRESHPVLLHPEQLPTATLQYLPDRFVQHQVQRPVVPRPFESNHHIVRIPLVLAPLLRHESDVAQITRQILLEYANSLMIDKLLALTKLQKRLRITANRKQQHLARNPSEITIFSSPSASTSDSTISFASPSNFSIGISEGVNEMDKN